LDVDGFLGSDDDGIAATIGVHRGEAVAAGEVVHHLLSGDAVTGRGECLLNGNGSRRIAGMQGRGGEKNCAEDGCFHAQIIADPDDRKCPEYLEFFRSIAGSDSVRGRGRGDVVIIFAQQLVEFI
jgi:hypothetical protein